MIAPADCVLILLAAGTSTRFGAADKLAQEYRGLPLGLHVVTALKALPFKARVAVCSVTALDFARHGYRMLRNERPEQGMSGSLKLGIAEARAVGCEAAVVVLADMPRVTAAHVRRLLDAAGGRDAVVASSTGAQPGPPALFGADHFDALMKLEGDAGARTLIRGGRHVVTAERELIDIDGPDDLERLRGGL